MQTLTQLVLKARMWWARNQKELWLAFLLAAVCAVAIEYGKDSWRGPSAFKVYLIGKLGDTEIQSVFSSFERAAAKRKMQLNGVPIEIERRDDEGNPVVAASIAKTLAEQPDTLLVVGHVLSQETKAAVPYYMSAKPRIPIIATTETDDDLLSQCGACQRQFVPLIQMSPTNKIQAESAVKYAVEKGRRRFLLVSELNPANTEYSKDLMGGFRQAIAEHAFQGVTTVGQTEMGPPLRTEDLMLWNPDCVLYAGEPDTARTLINSLRAFVGQKNMTVVLSDSSVTRNLADDPLSQFNAVVYTYQSDAFYYKKDLNVFGEDAFSLVSELIANADAENDSFLESVHKYLGMRRVSDARSDLIRGMQHNAEAAHKYVGESGDVYQFQGYQRNSLFHVWEVQDGQIIDVDGWHAPKASR